MASKKKPIKKPIKKSTKKPVKKPVAKSANKKSVNIFHPLSDRVLVERDASSKKTPGGLIIPDTVGEAPTHGTVIAVGPGHVGKKGKLRPTMVKPGNRIMFAKFSGNPIKLDDKEYLILRETDIIGVVEN